MIRRLGGVWVALALLAAGCGNNTEPAAVPSTSAAAPIADVSTTLAATTLPPTSSAAPAGSRPYATESSTLTAVDSTRITAATDQTAELATRTIEMLIDVPVTDEPRPLVVFAHGSWGDPRNLAMLRTHLAAEGFVVVSPLFPLTNRAVPGALTNGSDLPEQIRDVSFVIDSVLADPDLGPRVNADQIGLVGHSLGGATVAGAGLGPDSDERVGAVIVVSAGFVGARPGVSVLVVHGDADPVVPHSIGLASYGTVPGDRVMATLVGGDHNQGIQDDESDLGVALRGLAAGFFAVAFGVDEGQVAELDSLPLDQVLLEAGSADGSLDDWRDYFSA